MTPWYLSKSIWAQVIAFFATMGTMHGVDLQSLLSTETQVILAAGIPAIIGIVMRLVTKTPIGL